MTAADEKGPRLFLVEDHEILTKTLSVALSAEGFEVKVAEDLAPDALLEVAQAFRPDVVLLDIDLGEHGSGIDLIPQLDELGTRVLMLTGTRDPLLLAESVEAGAVGVVLKSSGFEDLVENARKAASGDEVLSDAQRVELLGRLRIARAAERKRRMKLNRLTDREGEVLEALMDGKTADAIATESTVSLNTVRTHIRSILMKLEVNSQIAAVAVAREAGWPWSMD